MFYCWYAPVHSIRNFLTTSVSLTVMKLFKKKKKKKKVWNMCTGYVCVFVRVLICVCATNLDARLRPRPPPPPTSRNRFQPLEGVHQKSYFYFWQVWGGGSKKYVWVRTSWAGARKIGRWVTSRGNFRIFVCLYRAAQKKCNTYDQWFQENDGQNKQAVSIIAFKKKSFSNKMTPRSLILMKAFGFYARFSEAMAFSNLATSVSKVTIDVPKFSIVWLPG